MATMSNEETFRFIELYQAENCIWNPRNKAHKNKNVVNDAWKRIADTMGVPVHELKKRKKSLMTYFRSNLKKKISSLKSGAGDDDAYKPIWIFYDAMEVFLKDVYENNSICNSEQNDHERQEDIGIRELDDVESSAGVEPSDAGNITSSENNNLPIKSQGVQKRRSKNPPELQEASKHMSAAFNTLNKVLQTKKNKENKDEDDSDLFCKLLAKQLKDFLKDDREEIMYEIHGLIMKRRRAYQERMLQHSPSSTILRNRSLSAQSSSYSYESLPKRNISSPEPPSPTLYTRTSPSHTIIGHPSSSGTSYTTTTLPQNFTQETEYQAPLVDQQPILYSHTSPSHIIIRRPSSSRNSYSTTALSQNFNQETSYDRQYISNNVQVLSRETLQPGTINNLLFEAYEKAMEEPK